MIDDPKNKQFPEDQSTDQGSAGGQAYQDIGNTGVGQTDLNQENEDEDDINEE